MFCTALGLMCMHRHFDLACCSVGRCARAARFSNSNYCRHVVFLPRSRDARAITGRNLIDTGDRLDAAQLA